MDRLSTGRLLRRTILMAATLLVLAQPIGTAWAQNSFEDLDAEFETRQPQIADPLRPWNRLMFEINDKLYFYLLKPVAEFYKAVVPEPPRIGIRNFFNNLGAPVRFVACLLQGKSERAGAELGAFMVNTTVGILGFGNPAAKDPRLKVPEEDLGQSFGAWGIGHGVYLVWPLLGPSSLRDTVGRVGEHFLSPFAYVEEAEVGLGASAFKTVNSTSLHLGEYEALKKDAISFYDATRDAYVQYRLRKLEE